MAISRIQMQIDGTQMRQSLGIKTNHAFSSTVAQRGRQTVLATIGRISAQGDSLARVQSGVSIGDVVASNYKELTAEGEIQFKLVDKPAITWHLDTWM